MNASCDDRGTKGTGEPEAGGKLPDRKPRIRRKAARPPGGRRVPALDVDAYAEAAYAIRKARVTPGFARELRRSHEVVYRMGFADGIACALDLAEQRRDYR